MTDLWIGLVYLLWLLVCTATAVLKGRGLGWAVMASLLPPLYIVLLRLEPRTPGPSERVRCPLCRMGWVVLDSTPRVCSGCGEEVPYHRLQDEMHRDMM